MLVFLLLVHIKLMLYSLGKLCSIFFFACICFFCRYMEVRRSAFLRDMLLGHFKSHLLTFRVSPWCARFSRGGNFHLSIILLLISSKSPSEMHSPLLSSSPILSSPRLTLSLRHSSRVMFSDLCHGRPCIASSMTSLSPPVPLWGVQRNKLAVC